MEPKLCGSSCLETRQLSACVSIQEGQSALPEDRVDTVRDRIGELSRDNRIARVVPAQLIVLRRKTEKH